MTADHLEYRLALQVLSGFDSDVSETEQEAAQRIAVAQVHATLAVADALESVAEAITERT